MKQTTLDNERIFITGCGMRGEIYGKRKKEHKNVAHTVSITKRRSALAFYLSRLDIDDTPPRKIFD